MRHIHKGTEVVDGEIRIKIAHELFLARFCDLSESVIFCQLVASSVLILQMAMKIYLFRNKYENMYILLP